MAEQQRPEAPDAEEGTAASGLETGEPVAVSDATDVSEFIRLADPMGEGVRQQAGQKGKLFLASVAVAAEFILPPLLEVFRREHPGIELSVSVGNRAVTLQRLLYDEADLAVGGRPPQGSGITGEGFLDNHFILVCRPGHPLAGEGPLHAEELSQEPWLIREPGSGGRRVTEEFWHRNGITPASVTMLGSTGAMRQGAALGIGIALISAYAVASELEEGKLDRIAAPGIPVEGAWYALTLSRGHPFETAQIFLDLLRSPGTRAAIDGWLGPASRFLPVAQPLGAPGS